jgi:MFS family permease
MRLFYGWVVVAVGVVVSCVGMGGVMSLGVFLQPMADFLGWSRAGISTASTLAFLCMGLGGFLWGWLYDRYGARAVVLFGGLLQGLGLVTASRAQNLPVFLAVYGTAAGLAAGAVYVPLTAATASWFVRHRSLAVSLVSAGLALGTTLVVRRNHRVPNWGGACDSARCARGSISKSVPPIASDWSRS